MAVKHIITKGFIGGNNVEYLVTKGFGSAAILVNTTTATYIGVAEKRPRSTIAQTRSRSQEARK